MRKNKIKLLKLGFILLVIFLRRIDATDAFFSASASSSDNTITAGTIGFGPSTGSLQITKYFCPSGTSIDTSSGSPQKLDSSGNADVPSECKTGSDVRLKGADDTSGGDSNPPETDTFTVFNGTTGVNGTLEINDLSPGSYGISEFAASGSGDPLPNDFVLGFFCSTSGGGFDNNYEIADVSAGETTYCNIYNEDVGDFNTITPSHDTVLNEIMYNPIGSDGASMPDGEWVELYNNNDDLFDVAGWEIRDDDGHSITISTANSDNNGEPSDAGETEVPGKGFLVVYMSGAVLNNNGDLVELYDDTDSLIDAHTYEGGKEEGNAEARIPDGTGGWIDPLATPGRPNIDNAIDDDSVEQTDSDVSKKTKTEHESPAGADEIENENETKSEQEKRQKQTAEVVRKEGKEELSEIIKEDREKPEELDLGGEKNGEETRKKDVESSEEPEHEDTETNRQEKIESQNHENTETLKATNNEKVKQDKHDENKTAQKPEDLSAEEPNE